MLRNSSPRAVIVHQDTAILHVTQRVVVVVVLPDPFRGIGAWRNSTETQQSDHKRLDFWTLDRSRGAIEDQALEELGIYKR